MPEVPSAAVIDVEDGSGGVHPMHATGCCDVTSNWDGDGNIEYDVPACKPGTPPSECVHVTSTVQPLDWYETGVRRGDEPAALVALNYAAPHLHLGAISLALEDAVTNRSICKVSTAPGGGVLYGSSEAPGDEANYLTGLRPCVWGGADAPRFERRHPMRTVAVYNASAPLTGVMALWLMTAADVRDGPACTAAMRAAGCPGRSTVGACLRCAKEHANALLRAGCQDDMARARCASGGSESAE